MTSRIAMDCDGTRYRVVNPEALRAEGCDPDDVGLKTRSAWKVLVEMGYIETLPCIPERSADCPWGWVSDTGIDPPQYLANDPATPVRPGDHVIVLCASQEVYAIGCALANHGTLAEVARVFPHDEDPHAFLLSRADPTEDA